MALGNEHLAQARSLLVNARQHFSDAGSALDELGPLESVVDVIPLVRIQVRGVQTMSDVGVLLSGAGLRLTDASDRVLQARNAHRPLSQSLDDLRSVESALHDAVGTLATARRRTAQLDGYRLFGPLSTARAKLETELDNSERRATDADNGLNVVLWLLGTDGPSRLLVFSQNPDEVRPTGGYMGTYGVLAGVDGKVRLLGYSAMGPWVTGHPQAVVPVKRAPKAFRYAEPPQPQQLPNVNSSPDWPTSVELAMRLWRRGGEHPVDGAVSLMPRTMARIVGVLGPLTLTQWHETITEANLVDRLDFHTHREAVRSEASAVRKQFIVDLAHAVVKRVLKAPSSRWLDLGRAMAASFDAGEALMWTSDPRSQGWLNALGWSGRFPATVGDFFADAEFEYVAKNGGALRRTFDHEVTLRADGSGAAVTTMLLRNTAPPDPGYNVDSLSYITPYGPRFSTVDPSSDRPDAYQPDLAGHPTQGYLRAAQPGGSTSLRVAFRSRQLALPRTDGSLLYRLEFRAQPGHTGDTLQLSVTPPAGWRWVGEGPPSLVRLYGVFRGVWELRKTE